MGVIRNLFKKIEYYQSIDEMPIYNWFKINETNDLKWISKDLQIDAKKNIIILLSAWNKIFDEFIDTFGIPEKLKEIMEVKRDIFILQAQLALTKDRTIQIFIDIETEKLIKLMSKDKEQSTMQVKVYVEKFLGFKLNERETTVKEFYEYIIVLIDQSKEANGRR